MRRNLIKDLQDFPLMKINYSIPISIFLKKIIFKTVAMWCECDENWFLLESALENGDEACVVRAYQLRM